MTVLLYEYYWYLGRSTLVLRAEYWCNSGRSTGVTQGGVPQYSRWSIGLIMTFINLSLCPALTEDKRDMEFLAKKHSLSSKNTLLSYIIIRYIYKAYQKSKLYCQILGVEDNYCYYLCTRKPNLFKKRTTDFWTYITLCR